MTKIAQAYTERAGEPLFICDFSPPRGAMEQMLAPAHQLDTDWVSMAYNPGRSVRVNSAIAAHWIEAHTGKNAVFTIATRDMNKVAIQSLLLGAALLGLQNVIVVKGDEFAPNDLGRTKAVDDYSPTELIRSIAGMNGGLDFRGRKLTAPTVFCIGASIDMARNIRQEASLTHRKLEAGADFFISQPTFTPEIPIRFLETYTKQHGTELAAPIFFGVQIMTHNGISFGDVPLWVQDDLSSGRSGSDIALQVLEDFFDAGLRSIYLLPPILSGGRRNYDAAQDVLRRFRAAH